MLEKPDLSEALISQFIKHTYGLEVTGLTFLPLGYDINSAVYRVEAANDLAYFLKLRKGDFAPISVILPQLLSRLGLRAIIAPLETRQGLLFDRFENYTVILYPFIAGSDGYQVRLSDAQWVGLGQTLRQVHGVHLPPALARQIHRETFDPQWRNCAGDFMRQMDIAIYTDPVARQLSEFTQSKRAVISHMLRRAGELAEVLQKQSLEHVLCHSDAHPGNYLVTETGELFLVDWDNPIYAPKERDLMCIGSGMSGLRPAGPEERHFYQGYGSCGINQQALAYYRYERIIQDIAEFCKQILLGPSVGEDRAQAYHYFTSSFLPGAEVDVAFQSDHLEGS